jgi:hypothetical protein
LIFPAQATSRDMRISASPPIDIFHIENSVRLFLPQQFFMLSPE